MPWEGGCTRRPLRPLSRLKLSSAAGGAGTTELAHLLSSLKGRSVENTASILGILSPGLSQQAQGPSDKVSRFPLCVY